MNKIVVTGAAGFIGSHLCEHLLSDDSNVVVGVDGFVGETPPSLKKRNLKKLLTEPRFTFVKVNLLNADWPSILREVDVVFHLAGIPGVRSSWGNEFRPYVDHNILATQQLLEACRAIRLKKFIYASTSSVYGETSGVTAEDHVTAPLSPYGVSKRTGEHLCEVYRKAFSVPTLTLRYFTVYGPRQRPDMAFHLFIRKLFQNEEIPVFGDGSQTRDFTYVSDCVKGTAAAMKTDEQSCGEIINIGGAERASVLEVIKKLETITGKKANLSFREQQRGEPMHTSADIEKAQRLLGYRPNVSLDVGLAKEVNDLAELYGGT
ncbi:MAG TPA: NAD-dependent epimerase/dehydratase family protein [Bacillales bacterium]|nr:NAD-dependent epimerase/dehydratase family protein [Bacillales bacterium]